jgi:hypothetical protein
MPIVTIKFNLPEEQYEMDTALKGSAYRYVLDRITQEVFRPARKHGYPDQKIQTVMDEVERSSEIVGLLEDLCYKILKEEDVDLD